MPRGNIMNTSALAVKNIADATDSRHAAAAIDNMRATARHGLAHSPFETISPIFGVRASASAIISARAGKIHHYHRFF